MKKSEELIKRIFIPNVIYEGILTCYSIEKSPHAANMGFSFNDKFKLIIKPFKNTRTYEYVSKMKQAVINIFNDVKYFYEVNFGKINEKSFNLSRMLKIPKLKDSIFYLECQLEEIEEDQIRPKLVMNVVNFVSKKTHLKPITRAEFAVLEALIHSTRVRVFKELNMQEELENLLSLVDYYERLIKRVAPNTLYDNMMFEIDLKIQDELRYEKGKDKNT
jgi:hypothetical protein